MNPAAAKNRELRIENPMFYRAPLRIHFGGQTNLLDSGRRQEKAALASAKADFPSLPEYKNLLLAAQKQLLELPYILNSGSEPMR
jgi:hypothetical protein